MKKRIEEWRDIPGHPGYQASNFGRVRSVDRLTWALNAHGKYGSRRYAGKVISPGHNCDGYYFFYTSKGSEQVKLYVHRAVAMAFHGDKSHLHVNHKDNNPGNNDAENLEWCTPSQNILHAQLHGMRRVRLSLDEVRIIRAFYVPLRGKLATTGILAKLFDVQPQMIRSVATSGYKHV